MADWASSPSRKRSRKVYGDRFIPNRDTLPLFSLLGDSSATAKSKRRGHGELDFQRTEEANKVYSSLLQSELFGSDLPQTPTKSKSNSTIESKNGPHTPPKSVTPSSSTPSTPSRNLFTYMNKAQRTPQSSGPTNPQSNVYSLSPVRFDSQRLLLSPRKQVRSISKIPFKVLDAPDLADDFYLNLVDWGSENILAVGLGSCVYLWTASTGKVTKLCDLGLDAVTSVSWIPRGLHLALGTNKGLVHIWDSERCKRVRTLTGHSSRAGSLAWNEHILSSGSRDHSILHRDVRSAEHHIQKLYGHKQEVCGLRWNSEDNQLASGGNDNRLYVWSGQNPTPLHKFTDHTAAVKAIAWSPHQRGTLASGGGTADRRIKFWNTHTGQATSEIDTGSQVCNLAWSKNSNELISTHGYSQNQVIVWKYPSMQQITSLTGHTYRVLYLATSPDGETVVTGAGDETLRFWNVFGKGKSDYQKSTTFDMFSRIR